MSGAANARRSRDGHLVRVSLNGQPMPDQFGWPVGDPRSPATIIAAKEGT